MVSITRSFIAVSILALFICGCAGQGLQTPPTVPDIPVTTSDIPTTGLNLTDTNRDATASRGDHYCLQYNLIQFDVTNPADLKYEIIPLRGSSIHLNILKLLEVGSCTNCFRITAWSIPNPGVLNVDIEIRHPFPDLELSVFDVRGIIMFNGSHTFPISGETFSDPTLGDGELINTEGLTALYNGSTIDAPVGDFQKYFTGRFATTGIPTATLNSYLRHNTDDPSNTRNAFWAGDAVTRTYSLRMPTGPGIFTLGYAVDANWAPATDTPVDDPITDFGLEANCPEAWQVILDVNQVNIGLNTQGGSDQLEIYVHDWQGVDSYSAPVIECPELFDGQHTASFVSSFTGYDQWTVDIPNEELSSAGYYFCLIRVVDDENAGAPPWLDLAAYQIIILEVIDWYDMPPVAAGDGNPKTVNIGEEVNFIDAGSYDPDGGSIVLWEWDFENDGVYDMEGNNVNYSFSSGGEHSVQMRVTDDDGSTNTLNHPIYITVNASPVAIATPTDVTVPMGTPVMFSGSASTDSDGTIVLYEWDWENDSVFDETGMDVLHSWDVVGDYEVNLRVTDDLGGVDTLDVPVQVHVVDSGWARTWGGSGQDRAQSVDFDTDGNAYVAGFFNDEVDFDPGPDISLGTSQGNDDIFLSMFDYNGNFLWAITLGSTGNDWAQDVVIDEGNGGVYLTGYFTGTVDFDPGPGVVSVSSDSDTMDAFVARFLSDGSLDWVRTWGGPGVDQGMSIDVSDTEVTVVGAVQGDADIDPGDGEEIYTSNGDFDISMARLDWQGNTIWAEAFGGIGMDGVTGVACDPDQVFITGYFSDSADFDLGGIGLDPTSNGDTDVFLAIYSGDTGGYEGVTCWGGAQADAGMGVAVDPSYIYVTGSFRDTVDFNPLAAHDDRTTNGETDAFLSVFSFADGYEGAYTWGGMHYDVGRGICIMEDLVGGGFKTYVTGLYTDTVDFNPSGVPFELTTNGLQDIFVARFGDSGFETAIGLGSSTNDMGLGISGYTATGMLGVVGTFQDSVDFDPGAGDDPHVSNGSYDAFYMKLTQDLGW
ncbi:MAG: PKD domain-containing protein [bacterium]|nr:PKD domain-containing protein [bacterium]